MGKSLEKRALEEAAEFDPLPDLTESRGKAVVRLRMAGASFQQIKEIENFTSATIARRVFESALALTVEEEDIAQQRALASMRLERLLQAVWTKALKEDTKGDRNPDQLAYVRTAAALIDRHAKLHGLDAPQRMEVITPDSAEKQAMVRLILKQITDDDLPREADIIDAEVIEDDE